MQKYIKKEQIECNTTSDSERSKNTIKNKASIKYALVYAADPSPSFSGKILVSFAKTPAVICYYLWPSVVIVTMHIWGLSAIPIISTSGFQEKSMPGHHFINAIANFEKSKVWVYVLYC